MTPPPLRVIEAGGRLLQVCNNRRVREMPTERFFREMGRAGMRVTEVTEAVLLLDQADLLKSTGDRTSLTPYGVSVADGIGRSWRYYCLAMLGLPWAQQAVELSISCFNRDGDGALTFNRGRLARIAPQLAAVISWLTDSGDLSDVLGAEVAERLLVSAHLGDEQATSPPSWVLRAADVGHRAEQYSLHLERSQKPPWKVLHVAAESDRYGYDIEDRTADPPILIEVKGSASSEVGFFVTRNELQTAATHPDRYVVQFWGAIDLQRPMRQEYGALRAAGYPHQLTQLTSSIDSGDLLAEPTQWIVTQSKAGPGNLAI